ncbi:MAG TPA: M50 family metallopeptidase [Pyrinomonadaceae bacterium]|nr:M50 family metallopeptidase [Pyrinomonadaceae bacterium]
MKYKIAHDARPQAKALLAAAALSLALWFIPYAWVLSYPFQLFVTFIHEGGHALAAVLTGNSVQSLSVALDTSGLTETITPVEGSFFSRMLISSAGYIGAISFGALLLWLVRMRVKARVILVGSAVIIAGLTAVFGFFVPLTNFSFSPFTVVSGAAITLGLLAGAKYLGTAARNFLVSFLAVQCVLDALFNLRDLLYLSVGGSTQTDAGNMAALTGIPSIFWALFWIIISLVILALVLRVYVAGRERPTQPDLPFEDEPLEV